MPVGPDRFVHSVDDAMALLDLLFDDAADRWSERGGTGFCDRFYADRGRGVPFFRWAPDESLVRWQTDGDLGLRPGMQVLELGCGPGLSEGEPFRRGGSRRE